MTALFAAIIGFAQNDLKKVLAYSTVSQLGFMFVGVGAGALRAAASSTSSRTRSSRRGLFLGAGSVMHAHERRATSPRWAACARSCRSPRGRFWSRGLAISGVPASPASSPRTMILRVGASPARHVPAAWLGRPDRRRLTAFYMFRAYFLVFSGETPRRRTRGSTTSTSRRR